MLERPYRQLIEPKSSTPDSRNRELVLNCLLLGTILLATLALLNTIISLVFFDYQFLATRIIAIIAVLVFLISLYGIVRKGFRAVGAVILIGVFFLIAAYLAYYWGTVTPTAVLMFGFSIIMAGVLLSARYSLYVAGASIVALVSLQYLQAGMRIQADLSWMQRPATMGDIIGFCAIYGVLALSSWLFNHQMERSLQRAQRSEAALSQQKALLEVKVEERTRQLEAAQLEKIQHVYRFAELGRTSSALFHDLANHLTSMSLDIEGLKSRGRSDIMQRIKNDVQYIDDVVQRVRFQLRGQTKTEEFNVAKEITQVIKILKYKTGQARTTIKVTKVSRKPIMYVGDVTRFRQLIINLLSNAIEAYPPPTGRPTEQRLVDVKIEQLFDAIVCITVTDWGVGIKPAQKRKVFEPFYSKKPEGTGIGLFIVKQIIEQDMHGTIKLTSSPKRGTVFTVHLPTSS